MTLRRKLFLLLSASPTSAYKSTANLIQTFLALVVLVNLSALIFSTVDQLYHQYYKIFIGIEVFSVSIYIIEYLIRIWSCVENPQYKHPLWGRLRYARSPFGIIDLIAILPSLIPYWGLEHFKFIRLLMFLRILKLTHYDKGYRIILQVFRERKEPLAVSFGFVIAWVIFASSIMFLIENEAQPEVFSSIPMTIWWAVITLTTVGYGDMIPVTAAGKFLAIMIAFTGMGLFAVPAGILASGFSKALGKKEAIHCPHCHKEITTKEN